MKKQTPVQTKWSQVYLPRTLGSTRALEAYSFSMCTCNVTYIYFLIKYFYTCKSCSKFASNITILLMIPGARHQLDTSSCQLPGSYLIKIDHDQAWVDVVHQCSYNPASLHPCFCHGTLATSPNFPRLLWQSVSASSEDHWHKQLRHPRQDPR